MGMVLDVVGDNLVARVGESVGECDSKLTPTQ